MPDTKTMIEKAPEMFKSLKELYEHLNDNNQETDSDTRWPEVRDLIRAIEGPKTIYGDIEGEELAAKTAERLIRLSVWFSVEPMPDNAWRFHVKDETSPAKQLISNCGYWHPMTKGEVVKHLGLDQFTFDYALPQPWLDEADRFLRVTYPEDYSKPGERPYEVLISGLVWLYDKHGQYTGRPYPLTRDATEALKRLPIRLSQLDPKALETGQLEIPKPEPKE